MATVTLGLGSNLGDRLATLQRAVDLLAEHGVVATACSRVWETEPIGGPQDQPAYLNAVVRARTAGDARNTLDAANHVEAALGRTREVHWGARSIDIDILLVDDLISDDPELTIPHPRMMDRSFVLLPLLEIDPDPVLPGGVRVLDQPSAVGEGRPFAAPLLMP